MKKGILTAFAGFLFFMAACTVIAKGIYRSGLLRVTVCNPEKRSLVYKISAPGIVLPGQEYGIYAAEGLRVGTVFVQAGDSVTAGDALFSVELGDLAEQMRKAEREINFLKAQLLDIDAEKKGQSREREKAAERLLADYESLLREQDLRIRDCNLAVETARLYLRNAVKSGKPGSVSGPDPGATVERKSAEEKTSLEIKLLQVEYEKALNQLEEAKLQKEEAIRNWNRSLEDARQEDHSSLSQTVRLQGELDVAQMQLEEMRELERRQGVVTAQEPGILLEIFLKTGERTGDGTCMLYSALAGGGDVQVCLAEAEAARLSVGDSFSLQYKTLSGEKKKETGIVVYMERSDGVRLLRIRPEGSALLPGQSVQAETSVKSGSYECVLPVSTLRYEELSGYYVYVVEPQEGILGTEDRLRKVYVTVLEQSAAFAAVESPALSDQTAVVVSATAEPEEGAVVRVLSD